MPTGSADISLADNAHCDIETVESCTSRGLRVNGESARHSWCRVNVIAAWVCEVSVCVWGGRKFNRIATVL